MATPFKQPDNIFLKARLRAAEKDQRFLNRIYAAGEICSSVDSLGGYEAGDHFPPDSVVLKMAEVYQDMFLVFEALEQTEYGRFLKKFFGLSVSRSAIPEAILSYVSERNDLSDDLMAQLMKAGKNSEFDEYEQPVVRTVADESREFINRAVTLICLMTQYKEKTAAGTTV